MNKPLFYILIFFLSLSCGKSPFESGLVDDVDKKFVGKEFQKGKELDGVFFSFIQTKEFVLYDENEALLEVRNFDGELVSIDLDKYEIYLWMPDHGHGSYPLSFVQSSKRDYVIKDIIFTMPGLWNLIIKSKEGQSVIWNIKL